MDSVAEIWKAIPGYEGKYEASTRGRIRSVARFITQRSNQGQLIERLYKGKVLRMDRQHQGYMRARLGKYGGVKSCHRLIALTFIGPYEPGMVVNHKNGIKDDNRPENLEYVTPGENIRHAFRTGLLKPARGERHRFSVLTEELVRAIRRAPKSETNVSIAKRFGVSNSLICNVRKGVSWRHVSIRLPIPPDVSTLTAALVS